MVDNKRIAWAYAAALRSVADCIEDCPEAYFGAFELSLDSEFDLQVGLERDSGGIIPRISLKRESVPLDREKLRKGAEQFCKFNW